MGNDEEMEKPMKKAGILIDSWKLPIFKKHLDAAGRTYKELPGVTARTITLQVQYEQMADLAPIVKEANQECANMKLH